MSSETTRDEEQRSGEEEFAEAWEAAAKQIGREKFGARVTVVFCESDDMRAREATSTPPPGLTAEEAIEAGETIEAAIWQAAHDACTNVPEGW